MKDSVVGEERIAQYLLAVLNSRGTPLHWRHLNNRRIEELRNEYEDKHDYDLKDLLPNRRKLPNRADVKYIKVIDYHVLEISLSHLILQFLSEGLIYALYYIEGVS